MGHRIHDPDHANFITCVIVNHLPLFKEKVFRDLLIDSLQYSLRNKHWHLNSYAIMPNHWHAIVSGRAKSIPETVKGIKAITNRKIVTLLNQQVDDSPQARFFLSKFKRASIKVHSKVGYKVWNKGYYPIPVYSKVVWRQKERYIHQNPVKAGLVALPEEYLYSSAHPNNPLRKYL